MKFVIFLPNVKVAENPFPGAPSPLFVYDMNIWFPVDDIVEGRVFPVKTFNTLLQEQVYEWGLQLLMYQQLFSLPPL